MSETSKPIFGDSIIIRNGAEHDGEPGTIIDHTHGYYRVAPEVTMIQVHQQHVEALSDTAEITLTTREELDMWVAAYNAKNAPDSTEDTALKLVVVQAELIRRYEKRIAELEAALTPFAKIGQWLKEKRQDFEEVYSIYSDTGWIDIPIALFNQADETLKGGKS